MICIIKILKFHVDNFSVSLRNLCFNKQKNRSRIPNECSWILLERIYAITSPFSLTRDEIFPRVFLSFSYFFSPCYYYYHHSFHTYKIQLTSGWWMRIVILLHLTVIFFIQNAHHKTKYQDIHYPFVLKSKYFKIWMLCKWMPCFNKVFILLNQCVLECLKIFKEFSKDSTRQSIIKLMISSFLN